ncbi:MAG: hypothetical protein Q9160_000784 [Pyrenula sp. 1 TL-2023]
MAEAAGLALGTVALASLFSTCLELLEYFELGKSYEYDYELACLKLSLLKSRLDTWGHCFGVSAAHEVEEELETHWPRERIVIHKSLQGIAGILGNAELLKDKYCLLPRKGRGINVGLVRSGQAPVFGHGHRRPFSRRVPSVSFCRRSTTWAIRDKQKFDNLIADLEFLISNLEKVSARVRLTCIASSEEMGNQSDSPQLAHGIPNITDPRYTPSGGIPNRNLPRSHRSSSSETCEKGKNPPQTAAEASDPGVSNQSTSRTHTESGYAFSVDKIDKRAAVFHGTLGDATLQPAPNGQQVKYRVGNATDDARVIGGAMSDANLDNFLNTAARESRVRNGANASEVVREKSSLSEGSEQ